MDNKPSGSTSAGGGESSQSAVEPSVGATVTALSSTKFRPIGPRDIKKKYKFIEPPGISQWGLAFAKRCALTIFIYSLGYFQVSPGWLVGPIILMVMREQWRRSHDAQREIAKAAARGDEREILLARLGENLPSWVTFPDVERAEWLNQILEQIWPRINNYTYDLVVSVIEPVIRDTLATSYKLGSFRFEKIILGDMPMRVRGVKVYDSKRTDRDEIIMDLDVIYAGDCDFRFSLAKIKAGIKDLQISGTLRLILKPLINQIPLIGGVQYFFLNPPALDFNLIGMADIFDMPGLSDLIRRIVQEQISAMVVLPNKMFIQLSDTVNPRDACTSEPQGVIRVCAIEARNLLKKDVGVLGTGKSDPYVTLSVGAQQFKSKIINNTVNPKWDFHCEMLVEEMGQTLNLTVYDHDDAPRTDEFLGSASVDLHLVRREGVVDVWLELEGVKKGQIHLKLVWFGFTENPAKLKEAVALSQGYGLAAALLTVRLDSAKNLPHAKEGHKPDPYAILSVGKKQLESVTLEKTDFPVFEETFHFLVNNPLTDTLVLKMMDRKSSGELGTLKQSLDTVFGRPKMTFEKQNLALNSRGEARITLDMKLRVLYLYAKGEWEEEMEKAAEAEKDDEPAGEPEPKPGPANPETEPLITAPEPEHDEGPAEPLEPEALAETHPNELVADPFKTDAHEDMKIQLTIRYSAQTQSLVVVVLNVTGLPIYKDELPDPYVKMYVLPEKSKKCKTEAQKDQTDPKYDERFDFPLLDLRGKTLHVQVCDKKFLRKSPNMGQVFIPLDDFYTGNAITNYYPLVQ